MNNLCQIFAPPVLEKVQYANMRQMYHSARNIELKMKIGTDASTMGTGEGVTGTSVEIVSNPRRHQPHPRYAFSSPDVKVGFCTCFFCRRSLVCGEVVGSPDPVL